MTAEIQETSFASPNINVKLVSFQKYLSTGNWLNSGVFQGFKDISGVFQGHSYHSIQPLIPLHSYRFDNTCLCYEYGNLHMASSIKCLTWVIRVQDSCHVHRLSESLLVEQCCRWKASRHLWHIECQATSARTCRYNTLSGALLHMSYRRPRPSQIQP